MLGIKRFISESESDTFNYAYKQALELKGGECIALYGDLGAGKTVFAKGLAKGLGIDELVTSPTFTIMNVYEGGRLRFYHFDMYRIDASQAEVLGFRENIEEKNAVCLIEWPENVPGLLPHDCIKIEIKRTGENTREIKYD